MRRVMLSLALLGGCAAWAQGEPPAALRDAVQRYAEKAGVRELVRWRHALVDLNGDGARDAVVLLLDPDWCGTGGCTMLVLRGAKGGQGSFALVSSSSVTDAPVRVAPAAASGWKTLIVYSRGRGDVLMRFDGKRYPSNPSLAPKASAAQMKGAALVIE